MPSTSAAAVVAVTFWAASSATVYSGDDSSDPTPICEVAYEDGLGNAATSDRESWIADCVSELGGFTASTGTLSEEDARNEFNQTIADVYVVACDPAFQDWDMDAPGYFACYGTQTNLDGETRIVFAFVYADEDGRTVVDEQDPITAEDALGFPADDTEGAAVEETMAVAETTEPAAVDEITVEETLAVAETTEPAAVDEITVEETLAVAETTESADPPTPNLDNAQIFTVGDVVVPAGDPGVLSVALTGPSDGSSVPMIVRNNTSSAVEHVEVSGIARDGVGGLIATGASQGFIPDLIQPGQWSIGYVYFDSDDLTGDETFEFAPTGDPPSDSIFGTVALTITEAVVQLDGGGSRIVGIVQNNTAADATLAQVYVACFEGPLLLGVHSGFADADPVAAGGLSGFTVSTHGDAACPSAALASGGYDL